jgi:hypothetical protein
MCIKIESAKSYIDDVISQSSLNIFKKDSGTEPDMNYNIGQYHACLLCKEIIDMNNMGNHIKILKDNFTQLNNLSTAYLDGFTFTISIIEDILN